MAKGKKRRKVMMPRGALAVAAKWEGTRGSYLTNIPPLDAARMDEVEVFSIREPFSYARIIYDRHRAEYVYEVWEPQLDEKERKLLHTIKDALTRTLEYEWEKMATKDKEQYLQEAVESFLKSRGVKLEPSIREKLEYYIIRDFVGYGPIDAVMADPRIEDVSCDGVAIPLFIFHQKYESIKTSIVFADDDVVNNFVVALGQRCGKQISVAAPILDGTSTEGHRVQATYAREVTTRGSSFTIRRFKENPFTPVERGPDGKAPGEIDMYDLVRAALRQRPNFIIVGEVRGKETYTMFQAMATGHPTMSTMHADSVKSMVNRLENPPINTPRILLTALNFVIIQSHARIGDSIVRRMKQIVELVGFEPETNELITNTVEAGGETVG